jgi:hypothetical protein
MCDGDLGLGVVNGELEGAAILANEVAGQGVWEGEGAEYTLCGARHTVGHVRRWQGLLL